MDYLQPLLIIAGGVLASAAVIAAKLPAAKRLVDKLAPYRALIGLVLLGWGIVSLVRGLGGIGAGLAATPVFATSVLVMIASSIALGFLFGMPQIARWVPGEPAAETKALELSRKIAPYQALLGLLGIGAALVFLAVRLGVVDAM